MKAKPLKKKHQTSRLSQVVGVVCDEYQITEKSFMSNRRFSELAYARFHYWHILYNLYGMNYSQIARAFGMTHGAIMNGLKRIGNQYTYGLRAFSLRDNAIRNRLEAIEKKASRAMD